jgi:hypothetical protein
MLRKVAKIAPFSIQSTSLDKIYTSGSQCTFYRNIRIQNEEKCSSNMLSDGIDHNLAFEEIHLNENGYHQIKGKMETTDLFE